MFFHLSGDDELERVQVSAAGELRRLEEHHHRADLSVFGEFELSRVVYGTREDQCEG